MKKSAIIFVAACLFCVFAAGMAHAQKIAYVNTDKVVKKSPQKVAILKSLEAEFKKRNDVLVGERKKLKKLEEKLEEKLGKDRAIMSSSEVKNIDQDIRRHRRELNNSSAEFRRDLNLRRSEERIKLLRKISEIIINIGKRDNIDMIMSAGVGYASNSIDISDKVLEQLEQEFKKKDKK
ncbi:MAG: OmpH family outer membrane protein [Gammaproteobacteria bacterium]|nr:OmpH family outer membrane protein [Gammaproteobacteria bacterium]